MTILKASLAYFALVFAAGFALGTFRVLVAEPLVGPFNAVLVELPVILTATAFAAVWSARQFMVPPQVGQRLLMGAVAFVLLQVAEAGLAAAIGRDLGSYLQALTQPKGSLGLTAQMLVVLMPVLYRR